MSFRFRWSKRASDQLANTAVYLEDSRTGAGRQFLDDVEELVDVIASSPRRFPRVPEVRGDVRRALIHRFGYWLIFEVDDDLVVGLAVWHGKRDPKGWR